MYRLNLIKKINKQGIPSFELVLNDEEVQLFYYLVKLTLIVLESSELYSRFHSETFETLSEIECQLKNAFEFKY